MCWGRGLLSYHFCLIDIDGVLNAVKHKTKRQLSHFLCHAVMRCSFKASSVVFSMMTYRHVGPTVSCFYPLRYTLWRSSCFSHLFNCCRDCYGSSYSGYYRTKIMDVEIKKMTNGLFGISSESLVSDFGVKVHTIWVIFNMLTWNYQCLWDPYYIKNNI